MNGTVSIASIACMAVSALAGFAIPVALFLYYRLKKRADILPFFIGCAIMFVFALTIESMLHNIVLLSPIGETIRANLWLYALYGGAMAGLFEESGRFIAFRFFLKKYRQKDMNALMYGAGHGGIEAVMLLGSGMISNIVLSIMLNTGTFSSLTVGQPPEIVEQLEAAAVQLSTIAPAMFLAGIAERLFAVVLQLSLSVIVWFGVNQPRRWYFVPIAFLIHFAVDAGTAIIAGLGAPILVTEASILAMSAAAALFARFLWKKYKTEPQEN